MKKSPLRALIAALALAGIGIAAPLGTARAQDAVRIGTSSTGSTFYILTVGISDLVRKNASINATVEPLGGSTANMNGLAARKIDLAMSNAGAAYDAYHGSPPFKGVINIALVAQGQPSLRYVLVRRDAGIKSAGDLVGKTFIAKRRALPELELVANALMDINQVPRDRVKLVETVETTQTSDALRSGSAQAAVYPGGLGMPPLQEMFRDKVVDFLPVPGDKVEALMRKLPKYFYLMKVPAGNFENQSTDWMAPALNTYLVVRGDVPEDLVYKITKAVMGNDKGLVPYHADGKYWTVKHTLAEPKIPFHAGAIRYYKEIGAWTENLDKIQASLARK